ncbi:hypothetical protein R1flu_016603 [Riccia fluitans]|uniref:Uncharacterized protein n=1 Tax=Riccia fluitans TaxID=41844 RepID=A0ABD1YQD8_9MARC
MAIIVAVDMKNWLKFASMFFDKWQQKMAFRLKIEGLWEMVSGATVKPALPDNAVQVAARAAHAQMTAAAAQ